MWRRLTPIALPKPSPTCATRSPPAHVATTSLRLLSVRSVEIFVVIPRSFAWSKRAQDIAVIERTHEFSGRYHVLGGALSPIDGVGPGQLRIEELRKRIPDEVIKELIIATNPTIEGDTTAMYLAREFETSRCDGHPPSQRSPGGRRHGLRRRDNPGQGLDRPKTSCRQPCRRTHA